MMKTDSNKRKIISIRVTEKEYELIDKNAKRSGLDRSKYIVKACLQNQDKSEYSSQMIDFLEMIQEYLVYLKKGKIKKREFIEILEKGIDERWFILK